MGPSLSPFLLTRLLPTTAPSHMIFPLPGICPSSFYLLNSYPAQTSLPLGEFYFHINSCWRAPGHWALLSPAFIIVTVLCWIGNERPPFRSPWRKKVGLFTLVFSAPWTAPGPQEGYGINKWPVSGLPLHKWETQCLLQEAVWFLISKPFDP